jgi:hypothetical protein
MYKIEIESSDVLGGRLQVQVAVECITRFNGDNLTWANAGNRLYVRVVAVKAILIVTTMTACFRHDHRRLMLHISRIGICWSADSKQHCPTNSSKQNTHRSLLSALALTPAPVKMFLNQTSTAAPRTQKPMFASAKTMAAMLP